MVGNYSLHLNKIFWNTMSKTSWKSWKVGNSSVNWLHHLTSSQVMLISFSNCFVSALSGAIFLCRVKANVWNMIQRFMIFTFPLLLGNVSGESWNTIAPIRNNCSQCPFVYNLVCGQDGKMYSSQCIAICRDVVSLLKKSLRNKSQF